MELAIVVATLGITMLAVTTTLVRATHILASLLWLASFMSWLLFTGYMYNLSWPAENTYLATGVALVGVAMALVSAVAALMPLFSLRLGHMARWDAYESQKKADRERILSITTKRSRELW